MLWLSFREGVEYDNKILQGCQPVAATERSVTDSKGMFSVLVHWEKLNSQFAEAC